jgi:DNA-binding helix-hairpin-helix protein with protein kinase domain
MVELYLPPGRRIEHEPDPVGRGDEALVLAVKGQPTVCVKYYTKPPPDVDQRLRLLMRLPPYHWEGDRRDHLHVAWPMERVLDGRMQTVGFVQTYLRPETHATLAQLFDPENRVVLLEEPTWFQMVVIARRVARLVAMLHDAGITIGDISQNNIFVSRDALVTMIDCDSMQVVDAWTGRVFPSTRATRDCPAPEILRRSPAPTSQETDRFGLAILICRILMEGQHPFTGVPVGAGDDGDDTEVSNIKAQRNRITHPKRLMPNPHALPAELLPPDVLVLAKRCFAAGHSRPAERPAAGEWQTALERAEGSVVGCRENPRHLYHSSLPECVWCRLVRQGHHEHFPSRAAPRPSEVPAVRRMPQPAGQPTAAGDVTTPTPAQRPIQPAAPSEPPIRQEQGWPTWVKVLIWVVVVFIILRFLG